MSFPKVPLRFTLGYIRLPLSGQGKCPAQCAFCDPRTSANEPEVLVVATAKWLSR